MVYCPQGEVAIGDTFCLPQDPVGFVARFYVVGLSIVGSIALVFLIYGGYVIMISRGNPEELNKGKSYIYYSLAGLFLAVFGYLFIQIVLVDILRIPGFQ
jgi:glucose uptake protein GlcU